MTRMAAHLEANPEARKEWELTQKLKNDPRITPDWPADPQDPAG